MKFCFLVSVCQMILHVEVNTRVKDVYQKVHIMVYLQSFLIMTLNSSKGIW